MNTLETAMSDVSPHCQSAIIETLRERLSQNEQWGEQNHELEIWLAILGEEFGELCQAFIDYKYADGSENNIKDEAIQCAAVALAIVESIIRKQPTSFGVPHPL